ncbi:MAG: TatD family deoxyribonuclease [Verrucomicrobia bacterium]|nr:TatD family deoxyribonuclease [Verrucomicrobiota bacterium]
MNPVFFDTHAHLDFPDFQPDLDAVIQRAYDAGIQKILCVGTDAERSRAALALAEKHPGLHAVVGWHPNHCLEAPDDVRPELRELARHPKVAAIGEAGVDHYRLPSTQGDASNAADERFIQKQEQIFRQQLEVAEELGLNLVVHQRAAWDPAIRMVQEFQGRVRCVFHCFSESPEALKQVLDTGGLVSFTGILSFKNGLNIREALRLTPMDRFMLETDCPFLAPVPYRGKRCEPAYVKEIAAVAAEVKGVSLEALSEVTCNTARSFFRLSS